MNLIANGLEDFASKLLTNKTNMTIVLDIRWSDDDYNFNNLTKYVTL